MYVRTKYEWLHIFLLWPTKKKEEDAAAAAAAAAAVAAAAGLPKLLLLELFNK